MYVKPCIRDIVRVGGQQGRAGFLRLDMNENPGGLPSDFVEDVKQDLTPEYLATYPEESVTKRLLAAYLNDTLNECLAGDVSEFSEDKLARETVKSAAAADLPGGCTVTEKHLCLTNGSDMAIRYIYEIFAEPGSVVVTVAPSFEMYRINSLIFGLEHCPVAIGEDFTIPVSDVLAAIREDTDLVVLLNPNNPIGRPYTDAEFAAIADRANEVGALVIVDEAYHYFYRHTFLKQALQRDNVIVLRTFSKLLSLAGCRFAYMTAQPQLIEYVNHVRPSFEVNAVALKFAEHLLQRPELITDLQSQADAGKALLVRELRERGYEVHEEAGNFVFMKPLHLSAGDLAARLETEQKVLVKTYGSPLLRPYLRISTGAPQYMEAFLRALSETDVR